MRCTKSRASGSLSYLRYSLRRAAGLRHDSPTVAEACRPKQQDNSRRTGVSVSGKQELGRAAGAKAGLKATGILEGGRDAGRGGKWEDGEEGRGVAEDGKEGSKRKGREGGM